MKIEPQKAVFEDSDILEACQHALHKQFEVASIQNAFVTGYSVVSPNDRFPGQNDINEKHKFITAQ